MAGAVHPVNQQDKTGVTSWPRFAGWLQRAIFVCLAAVALCAPLSTKGAVNAFRAAVLLWLIAICSKSLKLRRQPLALPLLLFLVVTAISSAFSIDPFLSWGRMRTVSLLFLAIVVGQALCSMRQVKILVALLIGSCLLTVAYTGWQYTAGIGVRAEGDAAALSSLQHLGLGRGEIIREIDGKTVRSPHDLEGRSGTGPINLLVWRETPNALQPFHLRINSKAWETALQNPRIKLVRAHPPRAQGFFKHYFPFSEILVFVGSLLWGFALSGVPDSRLRIAFLATFVLTAITLALTLTRVSLVSLAAGAALIILMRGTGRSRWINVAVFISIGFGGLYWVQSHRRAPESDPGTQYRLLMWRDSLEMMRAHPLLGVGLDAVAGDWQRWNLEAYRRFGLHSHFHSTPIQIAVECGVPALVVWIWLLGAYAVFIVRESSAVAGSDWFSRGLLLGALSGLIGFVLTGLVQYNFGDAEAMVVFWLVLGLTFAVAGLRSDLQEQGVCLPR